MKSLENTTASDIVISDTGVTLAASSTYIIPEQDYLLWAASAEIEAHILSGDVVVNDGTQDLIPANGVLLARAADFILHPDAAYNIRFLSEPERNNGFLASNVQDAIEEAKAVIEGKVSVLPTFLNNGNTSNKWLALDGAFSGSNDIPAITSYDSRLASLTFINSRDDVGIDLEFYTNGVLAYTWQVRNKRYAWTTSGLEAVLFNRGDRISCFARNVGGQSTPNSVIVFVNVQTTNSAQDSGGGSTLGY